METSEKHFIFFKYVKGVFVFIKKETIVFFYHVVCFFSMQKDKNRKRVIKLIRVFKKKRKRNKGKTDIEQREQKRLVFKNT